LQASVGGVFVHFPAHPVWFWLVLATPFLVWLVLWVAADTFNVSLKPLTPWLWAGYCLFAAPFFLLGPVNGEHKALRLVTGTGFWGCFFILMWIKRRYLFETLRAPGAKWYLLRTAAEFSVPTSMRILVRNVDSVSPWYVEKLGLRRIAVTPSGQSSSATFKFKEDGNSVTLTTRGGLGTDRTPILFAKKIGKIKNVLAARGVDVGAIEQDRQGIRFFQIHDPEGNVLEVVEER
jgi:predicted enzyme related to lactoylglutathione lyase